MIFVNMMDLMNAELGIVIILFILLFMKILGKPESNSTLLNLTNALLVLNLVVVLFLNSDGVLFNGMFHTNHTIALEKGILLFGTLIISLQSFKWLMHHKHAAEFYILLLSSLLGMFYMISSGNFLIFYLGLELASIPLAALANFNLKEKKSSEAALKLILLSAFASAIMLFGISILYGTTGTLSFSEVSLLISGGSLQILSIVFIFTGFAFKLSAVPFHFWTADVYEGAPIAITSFLSVISKAAMVFVFISVLSPLFVSAPAVWYMVFLIIIVLTMSFGNLFAIRQNNIKRFIAFSSITQVGYILLALSAGNKPGAAAAIYFMMVYIFSNLGALGVISLVSAQTGLENISDYRGFYKTNPVYAWILSISIFSLAGIPPTAGFFGKMFLVIAGASKGNSMIIAFASLNMVVSLYYYLKIIKAIFIDPNDSPVPALKPGFSIAAGLAVCMFGIIFTGFAGGFYDYVIKTCGF